ncbi:MAG: phosphotransferase [Desulfobacterales bacterium]|jgi:thiamine kinase-like enzyme
MVSDTEKIIRYLKDLPPALLGVQNSDSVEILEMTPGSYNLNYHVKVDQKEFIFRINIEPQSGLANQIEYEFRVLKFLEKHQIAPKTYHFDTSRQNFDFGILIEEYLAGPHLVLETEDVSKVVDLLARLHAIDPVGTSFVVWQDPLADTLELARNDLNLYKSKKAASKKMIKLANNLLAIGEAAVRNHRHLYHPDSLNHTDVGCDNFIKTAEGLKLIDWEKPRVDDCTYDMCCFLSEPVEMWCSQKILNSAERANVLNDYARLRGKNAERFVQKVKIREPLISLHWILWGATKLCDLKDHHTAPSLLAAHQEKAARFERIADAKNIEKLLDFWRV